MWKSKYVQKQNKIAKVATEEIQKIKRWQTHRIKW